MCVCTCEHALGLEFMVKRILGKLLLKVGVAPAYTLLWFSRSRELHDIQPAKDRATSKAL